ncbi:MAG: alpha/beta fold hydrolase [Ardenticatenaceae bacterium]|nr:alpha/beta fold hydrolase [Ardenticatenaceae bacterium]MCB9446241.1 alpha/beta fold hydrolase [Ardenticatenaceae bacterium]
MRLFRRVLRWVFFLLGLLAGLITVVAAFFAQRMVKPPRQRLWATPGDLGLACEDIHFPAQDGIRLSGWFVPAADTKRDGATVVIVHGWTWNRLGLTADDWFSGLEGSRPVDLLRLAYKLHQEGYHVLMFDLRNHGESADAPPVTFGWQEANDLLGALAYLNGRSEVNPDRIGTVGFSMGANTVLYTLPQTEQIKAAVAVQPASTGTFAERYGADLLGPLGMVTVPLAEMMYQAAGGLRFAALQPAFPAAGAGQTPVLYVQGEGDRWGSMDDVTQIAGKTPQASGPVFVEGTHRFDGYQYVVDHPELVTAFLAKNL